MQIQEREARVFARRESADFAGVDIPLSGRFAADAATTPGRKKAGELSTFHIILLLLVAAVVATAYISNILSVDGLMLEKSRLEKTQKELIQERENLRAEINMLTSYTRIQRIAKEDLKLTNSGRQPRSLIVHR